MNRDDFVNAVVADAEPDADNLKTFGPILIMVVSEVISLLIEHYGPMLIEWLSTHGPCAKRVVRREVVGAIRHNRFVTRPAEFSDQWSDRLTGSIVAVASRTPSSELKQMMQ